MTNLVPNPLSLQGTTPRPRIARGPVGPAGPPGPSGTPTMLDMGKAIFSNGQSLTNGGSPKQITGMSSVFFAGLPLGTNKFVVRTAGKYHVYGFVNMQPVSGGSGYAQAFIWLNGSQVDNGPAVTINFTTSYWSVYADTIVQCAVGDTLELAAFNGIGVTVAVNNGNFYAHMLSP